jgi:hypothetical protein
MVSFAPPARRPLMSRSSIDQRMCCAAFRYVAVMNYVAVMKKRRFA